MSEVSEVLMKAGIFKGEHGLEGLANAKEFWERQPYGTRLYYGGGIADYLHIDVLQAAIKLLAAHPVPDSDRDASWRKIAHSRPIDAVKECRRVRGCGLKEAKDILDNFLRAG